VTPDELKARPELMERLEIVYGGLKPEELKQATGLRWLQVSSAGVNRWITDELRERDVLITNASGIHAQPITEHMFGMLLQVTRCLREANQQQEKGLWRGYDFNAHIDMLAGKTLGILGAGAIGAHAAKVGAAFEMTVIGLSRSGKPVPFIERMYTPETRLEFFSRCDVVMNVLPLTSKTRQFMGGRELASLPKGAIVINAGRGETIDSEALMESLTSGHLRAACLDVTDPEPLPEGHPLWEIPNAYITPHYSGGHPGYMKRANAIFLDNLNRYLNGEELRNVVDKTEGY
jgi:phosphoglycerate dehydrogenase-like enzyme